MNKRKIGTKYEERAKEFLIANNYDIIAVNFYTRYGEIDIVAKEDGYLVFIEVKYRSDKGYGYGYEAVNRKKQLHMKKAAEFFLYKNKISFDSKIRFDVVSYDSKEITIIKNAF